MQGDITFTIHALYFFNATYILNNLSPLFPFSQVTVCRLYNLISVCSACIYNFFQVLVEFVGYK